MTMGEFNIPRKLIHLTELTSKNLKCLLMAHMNLLIFIRACFALSCLLFKIALEKEIWVADVNVTGNILHKSVQMIEFADDVNK